MKNIRIIFLSVLVSTVFLGITFCLKKDIMQSAPFSFKEIQAELTDFIVEQPSYFKASDGCNLAYYSFLGSDSNKHNDYKEIVVLYAGGGLYGNASYQWVAKKLQEKYGIGCYIFDLRGHGYSEGIRGDAPSMERVWQDTQESIELVKQLHQKAKVYLVGHSSGAGLLINYAAYSKNKLEEGYVFLAPYLGPKSEAAKDAQGEYSSFVKKARIWVYILGAIFPQSCVTHFKAIIFNYPQVILEQDPLILTYYTYAMSMATSPYEVTEVIKKIDKPVGLYIGQEDEQFIPEKVIAYKEFMNVSVDAKIIENVGHLSILLNAPELIAACIKRNEIYDKK